MMQILHSQNNILKILLFAALLISGSAVKAQMTEDILNGEYREIILKQLQKNVEKKETDMRQKAERYLLALPNDRKLYDESKLAIKADLVSGVNNDGHAELNYKFSIEYTCRHFESLTDNYPTGEYLCEQSNSSMALCELTRMMVDEVAPAYFKTGKKTDIKLKASTDITEVTHLDYGGEYGEFRYIAARYNGESVRISVSSESGINSNAQLAFLRAQGLKDNLSNRVNGLKNTENNYSYDTRSNSESGSMYRNVGIEILVHAAFDEEIVEMNERLINDEFIDYNIPKIDENSNDKSFVLIIANERYPRPLPDVPYAYNDGEMMQQYCIRTLGIPQRQVKIIEDATMQDIKKEGVSWLKNIASSQKGDCNFIIYYAGHGLTDYDRNPYLVPKDINFKGIKSMRKAKTIDVETRMSRRDTKHLLEQCLRIDTLCAWFNRVPVKSITMIVDATFDGNQRDGEPLVNMKLSDKKSKGLRLRNDIVLISAAAFDKTAFVFDEQHHGYLTYFMLKELKSRKGNINLSDLFRAVDKEVQRESSLQGQLQEPSITVGGKLKDTWGSIRLKQ